MTFSSLKVGENLCLRKVKLFREERLIVVVTTPQVVATGKGRTTDPLVN